MTAFLQRPWKRIRILAVESDRPVISLCNISRDKWQLVRGINAVIPLALFSLSISPKLME